MKKTVIWILTLAMTISLCACGSNHEDILSSVSPTESVISEASEWTNISEEASGAEQETSASIEESMEEAENTEEVSAVETQSAWSLVEIVDEFGDATGNQKVCSLIQGSFSNSATTDSDLSVTAVFDSGILELKLLEYGNIPVSAFSSDDLALKVKICDYVYEYPVYFADPFFIVETTQNEMPTALPTALLGGQEVKVVLYVGTSKYDFVMDGQGLMKTMDEMLGLGSTGVSGDVTSNEEVGNRVQNINDHLFTASYYFGDTNYYEDERAYKDNWDYILNHKDELLLASEEDITNLILGSWQAIYYTWFKGSSITFFPDGTASQTVSINNHKYNWETGDDCLLFGINELSEYQVRLVSDDILILLEGDRPYMLLERVR